MIRPDSSRPAEVAGPPVDVHCASLGEAVGDDGGDAVAAAGAGCEGKPNSVALLWFVGISLAAMVASVVQMAAGLAEQGLFLVTLCFGICAIAAWLDVATRRIPNLLTYPALLLGIGANLVVAPLLGAADLDVAVLWIGAAGPGDALLGFSLCAGIGIVSFAARGLGGGDVKLLAAVGALLGFQAVVPVLLNTLLVALVIGLGNWALRGTLVPRMQVIAGNVLMAVVTRKPGPVYPFRGTEAPFGLALLIGLVLSPLVAPQEWISSLMG